MNAPPLQLSLRVRRALLARNGIGSGTDHVLFATELSHFAPKSPKSRHGWSVQHCVVALETAKSEANRDSGWRELLRRVRGRRSDDSRRILYVDSDVDAGTLFAKQARERGVLVDVARDSIEALSRCIEFVYEVVVLPVAEGVAEQLLEPLGSLQTTAAILLLRDPLRSLAVTPPDDAAIAGMLNKPWTAKQLTAALDRALSLAESRMEWCPSSRARSPATLHVLFVGTSEAREFVQTHLRRTPTGSAVTVSHARSLSEASTVLEGHPIDAIISSLSLPDARGLDAVIHFSDGPRAKPFVALLERRDEPLTVQLLRHGAHDALALSELGEARLLTAVLNAVDRHRATQRVTHMAHHDPLTGLPNRVLFQQQLQASLSRASRKHEPLAVLYIDLDHFKPINDRHGHEAGDRVLQAVAARIRASVRDYDTPARLGGDEFAVVLNSLERGQEAETVARRLEVALTQPVDIGGTLVPIGCSVGIAVFPEAGATHDALLQAADREMYRVKRRSRNPAPATPPLRLVRDLQPLVDPLLS